MLYLRADAVSPPSWARDAICHSTDPDLFFPEKGESPRPAKKICAACPATEACLQYALEHDELLGVWGGATARERRRLRPTPAAAASQPSPVALRTRVRRWARTRGIEVATVGNVRADLIARYLAEHPDQEGAA